ncbi:Hypothetical Protein RSKD131_2199 [Cereibacter sphaeroides KD131]|nr:Hypothetical Protein RSKD131_2199 [Cereibacter sphaeroides KD131]
MPLHREAALPRQAGRRTVRLEGARNASRHARSPSGARHWPHSRHRRAVCDRPPPPPRASVILWHPGADELTAGNCPGPDCRERGKPRAAAGSSAGCACASAPRDRSGRGPDPRIAAGRACLPRPRPRGGAARGAFRPLIFPRR